MPNISADTATNTEYFRKMSNRRMGMVRMRPAFVKRDRQCIDAAERVCRTNPRLLPIPVDQGFAFPLLFVDPEVATRAMIVGFGRNYGIDTVPRWAKGCEMMAVFDVDEGGIEEVLLGSYSVKTNSAITSRWSKTRWDTEARFARLVSEGEPLSTYAE